jgi:hypothetical protein
MKKGSHLKLRMEISRFHTPDLAKIIKTNSVAFSSQANYTDRVGVAGLQSW